MSTPFKSRLEITPSSSNPKLSTHLLFDLTHMESAQSPIDQFLERLHSINKLSPHPVQFDALQGQLVLLGVIAAVESFLRTLFRKILSVDAQSMECAYKKDISYAAAVHLNKDMLPEAILERISFISQHSIVESIRDILGIKGPVPASVEAAIKDYVRVCHLRHCTVHRFGRLGASNAMALGINEHKELLEKPLVLDYAALQTAILICTTLVKSINNHLFNELISRIPQAEWIESYPLDKKKFGVYYNLFADNVSSRGSSPRQKFVYDLFLNQRNTYFGAGDA